MPLYEYKCNKCDVTFDVTRSYQERETAIECPSCGLNSVRVYSVPGVQFRGTGFYSTGG